MNAIEPYLTAIGTAITTAVVVAGAKTTGVLDNISREIGKLINDCENAISQINATKVDTKTKEIIKTLTKDIEKYEGNGSYTIFFASGMKYHGKESLNRAMDSAGFRAVSNTDVSIGIDWQPAPNEREAFKAEYVRLRDDGGPGKGQERNYNMIESQGKIYYISDNGHE